jgi:peptide/nickel transport system substrate-binding protein
VGLGPYRVAAWEPGASFEGTAFEQYVLGPPRIQRISVRIIGDVNTAMAYLSAGELDMTGTDNTIGFAQADTLRREWERSGVGTVYLGSNLWRSTAIQMRPEYAIPKGILDPRVRQALAQSVDKKLLNDNVWYGLMLPSDFFIRPTSKYASAFEPSIVKYQYDLRRSEQLMNEAGFVKGADGFYGSADEGQFKADLKTSQSTEWVAEMTIMAEAWRKAGFNVQDVVVPPALTNDPPTRTTFPAMYTSSITVGERALSSFVTAEIPRAENSFRNGSNRQGWSNPEYDLLHKQLGETLEPSERGKLIAQMARLFTADLSIIPLLFVQQPGGRVNALRGPLDTEPEGQIFSNVHEWHFE